MSIFLYPICWRDLGHECDPIHCVESEPEGLTDEQRERFDYQPLSFVCSGISKNPKLAQDRYRLCFKNSETDEITDNDLQDLTSLLAVIAAALNLDAVRKVNNGIVEIPAEQS